MKKVTILVVLATMFISCKTYQTTPNNKQIIEETLEQWHKAAAEAKFDDYFSLMTDDAIFIGTDPTENWDRKAFETYSKPHFDKGKAWNFTAIERNIFVDKSGKIAWFDELLDTQMKICRGSGVLRKENGEWKIAHYVLSITIPNDNTNEVVKQKTKFDDALINSLKAKK